MSDLIDRDALMKEFQTFVRRSNNHDYAPVPTWNDAVSLVGSLPSAEPERKKGEWEVQLSTGGDRPYIWWKCSECGQVIFSETERDRREFHAFCGRCGADMRGDE